MSSIVKLLPIITDSGRPAAPQSRSTTGRPSRYAPNYAAVHCGCARRRACHDCNARRLRRWSVLLVGMRFVRDGCCCYEQRHSSGTADAAARTPLTSAVSAKSHWSNLLAQIWRRARRPCACRLAVNDPLLCSIWLHGSIHGRDGTLTGHQFSRRLILLAFFR